MLAPMTPILSRRRMLTGLAAGVAASRLATRSRAAFAQPGEGTRVTATTGPSFNPGGPDADHFGRGGNYPVPDALRARRQGNPWAPADRVGAFSHLDRIYPTRPVARASGPWTFRCAVAGLNYTFRGQPSSLADYLARNPVTGLLIAKDDVILAEHYQYARSDADRLVSQSMVKSITGLLVGLAIADGAITSVDDTPDAYIPAFKGSEYGRTPIRALLQMSSGIEFGEDRDGGRDLNRLWVDLVSGGILSRKGSVASITQFNQRVAPPGTRFSYASIEADVLGLMVRCAVGRPLADYLRDKVWQPIGAEADAAWMLDAEGDELGHFGFNAVLRDYARLARLLAHDGDWNGRRIIPASWMIDATTVRPQDAYLAPGAATANFGYGYLLWLLPGERRQFALLGAFGQRICVDPASKLIMVHTALEQGSEVWPLWAAVVKQFAD
jgi:CubicO group peptidase (beta-lactamase class C family)